MKTKFPTINDHWLTFKKECYPEGMFEEQEKQLFRAFIGGSLSTFMQVEAVSHAFPNDDDACRVLETMKRELETHSANIINSAKGRN